MSKLRTVLAIDTAHSCYSIAIIKSNIVVSETIATNVGTTVR